MDECASFVELGLIRMEGLGLNQEDMLWPNATPHLCPDPPSICVCAYMYVYIYIY